MRKIRIIFIVFNFILMSFFKLDAKALISPEKTIKINEYSSLVSEYNLLKSYKI